MIEAAENVAQHYNISRNDQDLFAARSHRFVATHFNNGDINREIVPLTIKGALFDRDESLKQNLTGRVYTDYVQYYQMVQLQLVIVA